MAEQQISFFTSHDGVRLAYATYGQGGAQPLVFRAHWACQESVWGYDHGRQFLTALARGRRLITYDQRGLGASDRDALPKRVAEEVEDLRSLADHLGLAQFDLFSMFGIVEIPFAASYPDRVRRLVLWAPHVTGKPYPASVHASMRDAWHFYTRSAAAVICPTDPGGGQKWIAEATRNSGGPEYYIAMTSRSYDYGSIVPKLDAPTLVIGRTGLRETRVEHVRKVAALIPGARPVAHESLLNLGGTCSHRKPG